MILKQNTAFTRIFKLPAAGLASGVHIRLSKADAGTLVDPAAGAGSFLTEIGGGDWDGGWSGGW